jgi:hypothetical protein
VPRPRASSRRPVTHTNSLAHRKALLAETVEWRELKAHKGKKFEYFHTKPSWLPPIPNYFTGALE